MKRLAQVLSGIALASMVVAPCLFFADRLTLGAMQQWLLGATILWFVATPFWMEHKTT